MKPQTRRCTLEALRHFERIAKPVYVDSIKTQTLDGFIAARRREPGKMPDSTISVATVNKDLRHIKAVLRIAYEWGDLPQLPRVRMLKEPQKLVRYVTSEHFAAIYDACGAASKPSGFPFHPSDWWRALLCFLYMTGWRVGEALALRSGDLDLEVGTAVTRADDNKGGRDESVRLHSVIVDQLSEIKCFEPVVFPWYHSRELLWVEFRRIQVAAGIRLECLGRHQHTAACHVYGFHDLRRAFATMNADRLTGDALQSLMRHKSYQTTQRYINMARQMDTAVEQLHVPAGLFSRRANAN